MIGVIGSFGLCVGLFGSLLAMLLWALAARRSWADDASPEVVKTAARRTSTLTFAGALVACVAMEWALVTSDFSLRYVAENSSLATPLLYRVTALWSALDGSLLFWLLVLSFYGVVLTRRVPPVSADRDLRPSVLQLTAASVVSAVSFGFFLVTIVSTQPFARLAPAPADGPGPNPLLADHPAMAIHPPLLYLGYIGLVIPFGYAVSALVVGHAGTAWVTVTRRWMLLAWVTLTAGIILGAWWSYAVLGWGGYWAWDPVENASLLPWLTATALLHSVLRGRSATASPLWTITLAAASFLLVVSGTFLTRSGVVASVHSFTHSTLGPALLALLVVWVGVVLGLLIWRSDRLLPTNRAGCTSTWGSGRGTALLLNNVLLVGLAVTVLVGTLVPVVSGGDVSVGAPYYNRIAVPVGLAVLASLVFGIISRWRAEATIAVWRRATLPLAVAAVVTAALGLSGARGIAPVLALALTAAVVTAAGRAIAGVVGSVRRPSNWWRKRRALGSHIAHIGLAVAAAGVAASSAWSATTEATVPVGGSLTAGTGRAELVSIDRQPLPGKMRTAAVVRLSGVSGPRRASPALIYFPGREQTVTVPAIAPDWRGDVYLTVLGVAQDGSSATLRLADEPLVGWIWGGGALMVLGAAAALGPVRRSSLTGRPAGSATVDPAVTSGAPSNLVGAGEPLVEPVP